MQRNPKWRATTLEYWTRKRKTGNSFWKKEATSCDRKLKVTRTTRETTRLKYISIYIYLRRIKKIIKIWGKETGQSRIDEIRGRSVYLGGAYEEKLARAKSLQSGKTSILAVRQSVPGFIRNLQGSDIGDVLVPRHVPIKLETRFHHHNLARQIYKEYIYIYIFFPTCTATSFP